MGESVDRKEKNIVEDRGYNADDQERGAAESDEVEGHSLPSDDSGEVEAHSFTVEEGAVDEGS